MKRLLIMLLCCVSVCAQAKLWMPSIFSDGMVLQCDKPIPVWGEADPGTKVAVEFAGEKEKAVADAEGRWKVVFDPMRVSSGYESMSVSAGSKGPSLYFSDIRIGEVWILAGQSNMGIPLSECTGGTDEIAPGSDRNFGLIVGGVIALIGCYKWFLGSSNYLFL